MAAATAKSKDKVEELEKKMSEMDSKFNALIKRMHNIEKISEEERAATKLATKKITEDIQSMRSLLESANQNRQNITLLHQKPSNVEEKVKAVSVTQQECHLGWYKNLEEIDPLRAETYEWTIKEERSDRLVGSRNHSDFFKFKRYEYHIKAAIESMSQDLLVIRFQFKKGIAINQFLNKKGFTSIKYFVRDQSDDESKKDLIREDHLRFDDCVNCPDWTMECQFPAEIQSPPYMKDNSIKITMLFEPPSLNQSFVSNNGVLQWKADNYMARMEERSKDMWSPSFYTSPRGYRVRARFLFKMDGYICVEIYFLTGEHDDSLSLDFPHKTTVTLFNQSDPSKNLVNSIENECAERYQVNLTDSRLNALQGFVKDDSLLIKIVIQSPSWLRSLVSKLK